ncbi:MAG TPA: glucosamine-6-phosphate deaminase [Bacillales bacterium]|nr:glucosamine-6-phosphate deaminase [Bacillales bacterium]
MKVIAAENQNDMSRKAAAIIIDRVRTEPSMTLGMATGSTPEGTYRELIEDHRRSGTSYSRVTTVNLDEYVGLSSDHPNSFRHFMDTQLFQHLNLPRGHIHIPDGTALDLESECRRYDIIIDKLGGLDVQLLGIGENGHIGFNEPGTSFASQTHIVTLTESTRKANARFFESIEDVPRYAITMGIQSIFQSKQIVLLASGKAKAEAIERLVHGGVSQVFPASILNLHENVTLIADKEALALV